MFKANSRIVFGGVPNVLHSRVLLQSPVWHFPTPELSKVQLVRPQILALFVPFAMFMFHDSPVLSFTPPPGTAAAQTV